MKAEIIEKTDERIFIEWAEDGVGFGQLSMEWDKGKGVYILDAEFMGIDHVLKVIKATKNK